MWVSRMKQKKFTENALIFKWLLVKKKDRLLTGQRKANILVRTQMNKIQKRIQSQRTYVPTEMIVLVYRGHPRLASTSSPKGPSGIGWNKKLENKSFYAVSIIRNQTEKGFCRSRHYKQGKRAGLSKLVSLGYIAPWMFKQDDLGRRNYV